MCRPINESILKDMRRGPAGLQARLGVSSQVAHGKQGVDQMFGFSANNGRKRLGSLGVVPLDSWWVVQ